MFYVVDLKTNKLKNSCLTVDPLGKENSWT